VRAAILLIAFAGPTISSDFDAAIARIARLDGAGSHTKILRRAEATPELEIVVALSASQKTDWWDPRSRLGLFLQSVRDPGSIYRIASVAGDPMNYCRVTVERAAANDVALLCHPEKGGGGPIHKFVYDPRAKALVGRVEYQPFAMRRVVARHGRVTATGNRVIAVTYTPEGDPAFQIAADELRDDPLPEYRASLRGFTLPQSSYDEFAAARPRRVENGYRRKSTLFDEKIGPHRIVDGTLWFAKSFYDSEGFTGVGGYGYVDLKTRAFRWFSPPELVDWSATAMLLEDDAIWLGLASHEEWSTNAGGVIRIDRATQQIVRIALPDIVRDFARLGDRLVAATDFGIAVVENGRARRFFVDKTLDGRSRVVEANRQE